MNDFFEAVSGAEPRNSESWIEGYRAMASRTVAGALGIDIVSIDDDSCVLECEISDAVRQPFGLLHGGVSLLMAESAASMHAAWLGDLSHAVPVGVDLNGTHLRSATEGVVRAHAHVIRRARAFVFHDVDITLVETGQLLCKARVTNYYRPVG